MMSVNDFLSQIKEINEKVDLDSEFPDWNKTVQFNIRGNGGTPDVCPSPEIGSFYFEVNGGRVVKAETGKPGKADVILEGSNEALSNLFEGKLTIIEAFITKEITVKGTIGDAVGANVLLQAARTF